MIPYYSSYVGKMERKRNDSCLEPYKIKSKNNKNKNNIELNDNEYCSSTKKFNPNKGSPNQFESRLKKRLKLYYNKDI